eukprot:PLAT4973.1.p1 GENE.PLAT4973.1~~PLAT4973.1.p1  ORF type:complete len:287 (+),score=105.06 PLAT4973.1:42-902(+)
MDLSLLPSLAQVQSAYTSLRTARLFVAFDPLDLAATTLLVLQYSKQLANGSVRRQPPLATLFTLAMAFFSGVFVTHLITGTPPPFALSQTAIPSFLAVVWLLLFSPVASLLRRLLSLRPVYAIVWLVGRTLLSTAPTALGVDAALRCDHLLIRHSPPAAILCGFLTVNAGGIIVNSFGLWKGTWTFSGPPEQLQQPPFLMQASLVSATAYYMLRDPFMLLPFTVPPDLALLIVSAVSLPAFALYEGLGISILAPLSFIAKFAFVDGAAAIAKAADGTAGGGKSKDD